MAVGQRFTVPSAPATVLVVAIRSGGTAAPSTLNGFALVDQQVYSALPISFYVLGKDVSAAGAVSPPQWTVGGNFVFHVAAYANLPAFRGGLIVGKPGHKLTTFDSGPSISHR